MKNPFGEFLLVQIFLKHFQLQLQNQLSKGSLRGGNFTHPHSVCFSGKPLQLVGRKMDVNRISSS
jgi:hypothetical protein